MQQQIEPLDGVEARRRAHDGTRGRQAERGAGGPTAGGGVGETGDVDAVDNHAALAPVEQAQREALRLLRARDVDDHARPAREPPLERQVAGAPGHAVALEVQPVQRVHGGHAEGARDQPPIETGALAVRVDETHATLADQSHESRERGRVEAVRRELDRLDAALAEAIEQRAVARSRHDRSPAPRPQPAGDGEHVLRPAARLGGDEQLEDRPRRHGRRRRRDHPRARRSARRSGAGVAAASMGRSANSRHHAG